MLTHIPSVGCGPVSEMFGESKIRVELRDDFIPLDSTEKAEFLWTGNLYCTGTYLFLLCLSRSTVWSEVIRLDSWGSELAVLLDREDSTKHYGTCTKTTTNIQQKRT